MCLIRDLKMYVVSLKHKSSSLNFNVFPANHQYSLAHSTSWHYLLFHKNASTTLINTTKSATNKMAASSKYTAPREDGTFVMKIPTKTDDAPDPAHDQKIDLSQMDEQDIKSLRKSGE